MGLFVKLLELTKLSPSTEELLEKAESGDLDAQFGLACKYELTKDYSNAAVWYQKASDNGSAEAQYHLAHLYRQGKGVEKSNEKYMELLESSAARGFQMAVNELED